MRRYHPGTNKEVFGAEVIAIYQAVRFVDQRQENGHRYTLFVNSTAAIKRVKTDALGPVQRFAIAAMEVCDLVHPSNNQVAIRWVPAHNKVEGSEMADTICKGGGGSHGPVLDADTRDELLDEATISYMTRTATEARSRATAEWISSRIGARWYRLPPGRGLHRQHLRSVRKSWLDGFTSSCSDWVVSTWQDKDRLRQVLVVRHRRAPVQVPPRRQVPRMGGSGTSHVERDREDVRVGEASGSCCEVDV